MRKTDIHTRDGVCPSDVFRPQGQGCWPGVLMLMDAPGMRPAVQEMAQRSAGHGYVVLLPDLLYRAGPALTEAGVDYVVETYPARHGWAPRDMPAHDAAEAGRHWRTLVPFFDGALKA